MVKRGRLTRDKGAVGKDINAIQAQESMKKIVTFLKNNPEQAMPVQFALEQGFFEGKAKEELATCWPPTYMYFNQIPKYWLAGWLQQLNSLFSSDLAQAVDKSDKDALRMLVEFVTGLKPQLKLPRTCLCKAVLAATLTKRAALLGSRLSNEFINKAIDPETGVVNYKDFGVYSWKASDDGSVKSIVHKSGTQEVVPEEVCIKQAWPIKENYSDLKAHINHGVLHIRFSQQMPAFQKYCEYNSSDTLKAQAEETQREHQEAMVQSRKHDVKVDAAVLPKPKKRSGPPTTNLLTKKVPKTVL
jgi:hypothetical protein